MATIRSLFDDTHKVDRRIEKVITYGVTEEDRLRAEISEYVVTDSIEEQFTSVLERMQDAMNNGGQYDVGVWVSGFYGSGKSSFTKYLGLAFDQSVTIDGVPFVKHLQDRLHSAQAKALLGAVTQKFPAAVVMLDLASESLTGASTEDVSNVLFYKVVQWAGYSRNPKVAALERRIEADGRTDEFLRRIEARGEGKSWKDLQNDTLILDGVLPAVAHEMYPTLFSTPTTFTTDASDIITFQNDRVAEMIDIVRHKSGKQNVLFIVDEVGNYVASSSSLILNLDGLAKNIKEIGGGKAWIIATAQQTLTEDSERAALNSPELYKLKDRFPIKVDLESRDIKEICYKRLLAKSTAGATTLAALFGRHGQQLRQNTKLENARYYDADFDEKTFVELYPFLPAHFEILLNLLGALAKRTGGLGLRSAIKVVQDILIERTPGRGPMADQEVGQLATVVVLYEKLERDIRRAYPAIWEAVDKARTQFGDRPLCGDVCKTIGVLQIVGNIPITPVNIASLMHPSVTALSGEDDVRRAVNDLVKDAIVPLTEKDGTVFFLSEKLRDVERERGAFIPRAVDMRRVLNNGILQCFDSPPRCMLEGTMAVTAGLKVRNEGLETSLSGDQEEIQMVVEIVEPDRHEARRAELMDESRMKNNQSRIDLIARQDASLEEVAMEICRCQNIADVHKNDVDQEIRQYCRDQMEHATKLEGRLGASLRKTLQGGSFIFRGQQTAVAARDPALSEACSKMMSEAAPQVYDRYAEAPIRVTTDVAERLMQLGVANPAAVTRALDPLSLVEKAGGVIAFRRDHKAIVSIRDYLQQNSTVPGKQLLDRFHQPPFGWQPDATRYVLAVMLLAGMIKLRVGGLEITVAGPQAIEAMKTNNAFKQVSVSLRDNAPSVDMLARAAQRVGELVGHRVDPIEQEISKNTIQLLAGLQPDYAVLGERLANLGLYGQDRVVQMRDTITDVLKTDASEATQLFGAEESALYVDLAWAARVKNALDNGLDRTVKDLTTHRNVIANLPDAGLPGDLRRSVADDIEVLATVTKDPSFVDREHDLSSALSHVTKCVMETAAKLHEEQRNKVIEGVKELEHVPGWNDLCPEDQRSVRGQLEELVVDAPHDLQGFQKLLAQDYAISDTLNRLKREVEAQTPKQTKDTTVEERAKLWTIRIPARVTSPDRLDSLITELNETKTRWREAQTSVEVSFEVKSEG
jgi:hypothetical protein